MPVYHHGDPAEGSLNLFGSQPTEKSRLQKRMERQESDLVKSKLRKAGYKDGEKVTDTQTGNIAVIDYSAPFGLRPLWKAVNAHNHRGSFTLGVDDLNKARQGETYDGPEYGKLAGSEDQVAKRRANRPANPNSRL